MKYLSRYTSFLQFLNVTVTSHFSQSKLLLMSIHFNTETERDKLADGNVSKTGETGITGSKPNENDGCVSGLKTGNMILLPVFPLPAVQSGGAEPGHKHMGHLGTGITGQDQHFSRGILVGIKAEGDGTTSMGFWGDGGVTDCRSCSSWILALILLA